MLPGVYVASSRTKDFGTRARASLKWAGPGVVLGGPSAAFAHGLVPVPPVRQTLCAPRNFRLRAPDWIRVVQPTIVGEPVTAMGMRCVPVPDALLQVWSHLGPKSATGVILDAVRTRRVTAAELAQRAVLYPRIPHRRALGRILDPLQGGIDSYLEHLAATRVFNTVDFSGFRRQVRTPASGRVHILDMFDPETRVAVELDGRRFHNDDESRRRDLARDTELAAIGILTVRFTFEDIVHRPTWCRSRVRKVMAERRRTYAPAPQRAA